MMLPALTTLLRPFLILVQQPFLTSIPLDIMKYLTNQYRFSKYMIECGAGNVRLDYEEPPDQNLPKGVVIG